MFKLLLTTIVICFSYALSASPQFLGISSEPYYSCAYDDSKVYCWGSSTEGEVVNLDGFFHIKQIETEYSFGCVLDDAGIACWGSNPELTTDLMENPNITEFKINSFSVCALAKGELICSSQPRGARPPANLQGISNFAMSDSLTCVVKKGKPYCWGIYGESTFPADLGTVVKIDVRLSYLCALNTENRLYCWGVGFTQMNQAVPPTTEKIVDFKLSDDQGCYLTDKGTIACWGNPGDFRDDLQKQMKGKSLSVNENYSCMINELGKPSCWGVSLERVEMPLTVKNMTLMSTHDSGTCFGMGNEISCTGSQRIATELRVTNLTSMVAENNILCYVDDGLAKCQSRYATIILDPEITYATQLVIGASHVCGVIKDGAVHCSAKAEARYPVRVPPKLHGTKKLISDGEYRYCALTDDGKVYCWGVGTVDPVIQNAEKVKDISLGVGFICALFELDKISCWVNANISREFTKTPDHMLGIKGLISGVGYACAYTDKDMFCWGSAKNMQSPPKIVGKIRTVSEGNEHACFQDDAGIKCWGKMSGGQDQFYLSSESLKK